MKKALACLVVFLAAVVVSAKDIVGRVVTVADGDTLTLVDAAHEKHKIRFYGIDTPEKNQEGGKEAGAYLRKRVWLKDVRVTVVNTDRYGRTVGKVYLGEDYINLEMLQKGWAWYYAQYAPKEEIFAAAERLAREQKLGIWKQENPQPPWEFRSDKRNKGKKK